MGFAERLSTPEIGMEARASCGESYHRSFHDQCKVCALVFDSKVSGSPVIIYDLSGSPPGTVTSFL